MKDTRLAVIPKEYDKWVLVTFSSDGRQVFYGAEKKGKKIVVVASPSGQRPGDAYDSISFLIASPDGRRFAYGGKTGGKKRLVVDNNELKDLYHEEVAPGAFSPDGRFVACEVGGLKEKKWFILVSDGEKEVYRSPVYSDTWREPVFSPDGRLLMFELGDDKRDTENVNRKRRTFFLDLSKKKIIKEQLCADCDTGEFSFSSDSSRVVYRITQKDRKKSFLILQDFGHDKERWTELSAWSGGVLLTQDGKQIVYNEDKKGKQYLVVAPWKAPERGKKIGPYDSILRPVIGPDRTTVAFHAMKGGKWLSVVGKRESPARYDGVGDAPLIFSPDGSKIAYAARRGGEQKKMGISGGKWMMVVSPAKKAGEVKEGPSYDMVNSPVFSPDGRRIAYRARTGPMDNAKRFIVIADAETGKVIKESPAGDEIWPPVWSADSKAVGYGTRIGRELWWKVEAVS